LINYKKAVLSATLFLLSLLLITLTACEAGLYTQDLLQPQISGDYIAYDDYLETAEITEAELYETDVPVLIIPVSEILLGEYEIILNINEQTRLSPRVLPTDATYQELRFSTSSEEIVTVTDGGMITAHSLGEAYITVSAGDVYAALKVFVTIPIIEISIEVDRDFYVVGEEGTLSISIYPPDAAFRDLSIVLSGADVRMFDDLTFISDSQGLLTITVLAPNDVGAELTVPVIDLALLADEVLRLTNIERTDRGLEPFNTLTPLTEAARVRAVEITSRFSHTRPDGRTPFTAFTESGVEYTTAGENIAAGQGSPEEAVRSWMNSSGHRANILSTRFSHMGVGVAVDSNGRMHWVQTFTN